MTTREPTTQADLDGTSWRARHAYQVRLRTLRRMGLRLPPGAVIDDDPAADIADAFILEAARRDAAERAH